MKNETFFNHIKDQENHDLEHQKILDLTVCNNLAECIYISDPHTYDILYANNTFIKKYGNLIGQKCHKALQGLDAPCPFCTNNFIMGENQGKPHTREYKNLIDQRWYRCVDKAIPWIDGRIVRCEMFIDINDIKETEKKLLHRIQFETLITSISTQFINLPQEKIDQGINMALKKIGGFAEADRSYVFLFYEKNGTRMDNTHEWCVDGIDPQIDNLKDLKPDLVTPWWIDKLRRFEYIYIPSVDNLKANNYAEKRILQAQNIKSLVVVPMVYGKSLIGFLGFDFVRSEKSLLSKEIIGLLRIVGDIFANALEHKKAYQALRKSEKRFRRITENMLDMISQLNVNGVFEYASPSHQSNLGYQPKDLIGKSIIDFLHPDDINTMKNAIQGVIQTSIPGKIEFRLRHINGDHMWMESNINVDTEKGEIAGIIFCTRNINQRKQFEKEMASLDRLNLIGEMAAGIGHEIRNPMTTIRGFLQILKNKNGCVQYEDYFDIMIDELDRANSIITEFLSLTKNKPIDLQVSNLNHIIKSIFPLIQADAMLLDKYIELELHDIRDIPLNEKEIRQLLLNLVKNGIESMDSSGKITIKTFADKQDVILSVKDEGKGIETSLLDKLGTPFFTTKDNGTGLGLAVCYSIAARHKASIEVETGSSGTTFLVRFKY